MAIEDVVCGDLNALCSLDCLRPYPVRDSNLSRLMKSVDQSPNAVAVKSVKP